MAQRVANEKFRRPTISFTEGLKKAAGGQYVERGELIQWMFRALVIAVDTAGGQLETPDGLPEAIGSAKPKILEVTVKDKGVIVDTTLAKYKVPPVKGPRNPPNAIKARILSNNRDQFIDDDNLRVFWPLFPASSDTPSPGEMVYVVFEDEEFQHGLWLGRVAHNIKDAGVNQMLKSKILEENAGFWKGGLYPDLAEKLDGGRIKYKNTNVVVSKNYKLSSLFIDFGAKK
jgi:hypothetical protein